jgi:hypothetical protein
MGQDTAEEPAKGSAERPHPTGQPFVPPVVQLQIESTAPQREVATLRELEVTYRLVDHFLSRMGMSPEHYRGFAAIDPSLTRAVVARRLSEVARSEPTLSAPPTVRQECLLAHALWREGEHAEAIERFNLSLLKMVAFGRSGYAMLYATYRGHRLIERNGEFYALPGIADSYMADQGGRTSVMQHRSPARLRHWLRRMLPSSLLQWGRWLAVRSPLVGESRLEQVLHTSDLAVLLDLIDGAARGQESNQLVK